jgi:hypothetical protein
VVDLASSVTKAPLPFFANVNVQDPNVLFARNGLLSVACTKLVKDSWLSQNTAFSTIIPIPHQPLIVEDERDKILIDKALPEQYLKTLPITVDQNRFTTDKAKGIVYLHLWQNITPLMIDCMAAEIPIVTFQSADFQEIVKSGKVRVLHPHSRTTDGSE